MQTATAVLCMRVNRASALRRPSWSRIWKVIGPEYRSAQWTVLPPHLLGAFAARRGGVAGRGRRSDGLGVGIGEVDGELVMRWCCSLGAPP